MKWKRYGRSISRQNPYTGVRIHVESWVQLLGVNNSHLVTRFSAPSGYLCMPVSMLQKYLQIVHSYTISHCQSSSFNMCFPLSYFEGYALFFPPTQFLHYYCNIKIPFTDFVLHYHNRMLTVFVPHLLRDFLKTVLKGKITIMVAWKTIWRIR
jgi:hypothetical protein